MILDEIIDKIGKENFFKSSELSNLLNLNNEDTEKFIEEGLSQDILIEVSTDEYGFSEKTINKYDLEKYGAFSKFIESNFVISTNKPIRFTEEEVELRDSVYQSLLMNKKDIASESIVHYIENHNFIYTTKEDKNNEVWFYKDGIYKPQGESEIKEYVRKILGERYTTNFANLVLDKIKNDTQIEQREFFNQNYLDEVPVQNGILNIRTKELSIFNPRKIFFNKLPIYYDPTAKCPLIEKHFEEVLRNKDDSKVLFELFGYSLLKENRLEKAFMFIGNGRNGKSKTLELLKKFVGIENCSALPLSSMTSESFSLSELFGKMVNLAGDLSYTDLKETGVLKQLIGRDEIQTKRKFKTDLNFVNYAKLLFATNELPKIYDMTDGFWTKWILLEFPYKFITQKEYDELPEQERTNKKIIDTEIIEKISSPEELSGLLNKALESLDRILEQKEFSYSHGTNEVKDMWIRQSDSFMAFCLDNLEEDYNNKISRKELKQKYFKFCKKFRLRSSSDKSIKITLENMFGCVETRMNDTSLGWDGIRFKPTCEICEEISPYRKISNFPIVAKNLSNLSNKEKMINFFKENQERAINLNEIEGLFGDNEEVITILKELSTEGLIFEERTNYWRYLG